MKTDTGRRSTRGANSVPYAPLPPPPSEAPSRRSSRFNSVTRSDVVNNSPTSSGGPALNGKKATRSPSLIKSPSSYVGGKVLRTAIGMDDSAGQEKFRALKAHIRSVCANYPLPHADELSPFMLKHERNAIPDMDSIIRDVCVKFPELLKFEDTWPVRFMVINHACYAVYLRKGSDGQKPQTAMASSSKLPTLIVKHPVSRDSTPRPHSTASSSAIHRALRTAPNINDPDSSVEDLEINASPAVSYRPNNIGSNKPRPKFLAAPGRLASGKHRTQVPMEDESDTIFQLSAIGSRFNSRS